MQKLICIFLIIISYNCKNYSITANEFYNLWVSFIDQKITTKTEWIRDYYSDKSWTDITIGNKKSEEIDSPFGEFIKQKENLRYRKEDGLTDLSFATVKSFENISSIENKSNSTPIVTNTDFYPIHYEILLEHENNIYSSYEEMIKLAYERARLKVLITYNEDVDKNSDYKASVDTLLKNYMEIIKQANQKYPENSETEYLLIVGQKDNNKLFWYSYTFDTKGDLK